MAAVGRTARQALRQRVGVRASLTAGVLAIGSIVGAAESSAQPSTSTAAPVMATTAANDASKSLVDRSRAVLEAYCTECRDAANGSSVLDMDALANNVRLVTPHRPDSSRIYQRLFAIALSAPEDDAVGDKDNADQKNGAKADKEKVGVASVKVEAPPKPPRPTPAEIESVRDWIASLPARDEGCRDRALLTHGEMEELADRWIESVGIAEAADTRFVSLAHLWNACESHERLHAARIASVMLLAALTNQKERVVVETLGDASAILVFRLSALAMTAADWDELTASAPQGTADIVPADWLAAHVLSKLKDKLKFDGVGEREVSGLARSWTQDVDLVRASAERGESVRAFSQTLAARDAGDDFTAQRLLHGTLSRQDWDRLQRALDGRDSRMTAVKPAGPEHEVDVLLWTDKPVYRPRDLVTISATVSKACHLTVIDVDRDGKAVVLFPNELEQNNLVSPGGVIRIPGTDAGYQLRLEQAGEETLVAICQRHDATPEGIAYDYEKQRFAMLGDWRTFLRTAPEREKEIGKRGMADAARRRRRGRTPQTAPEPAAIAPQEVVEGRTAVTVTIERASLAQP